MVNLWSGKKKDETAAQPRAEEKKSGGLQEPNKSQVIPSRQPVATQHEERGKSMSPEVGKVGVANAAEDVVQPPVAAQPVGVGLDRLDRIRDILIGKEMQVYEKKLTRLEERLVTESAELRDDLKKRFDALELYTKKEIEALVNQVKAEQKKRDEAFEELSQRLKEGTASLERTLTQLTEKTSTGDRDLREQVLGQLKAEQTVREESVQELAQKLRDGTASLEKRVAQLDERATVSNRELREQLQAQQKAEQTARGELQQELTQRLKDAAGSFERKLAQLEEKTAASERDLRD